MTRWILVALMLCVTCSCSVLTPEQRATARNQIQQEFMEGNISQAQRDAAIEALQADEPYDWSGLGIAGLNVLLALLGAPAIVRLQRGPATQRVGLPKSKVRE